MRLHAPAVSKIHPRPFGAKRGLVRLARLAGACLLVLLAATASAQAAAPTITATTFSAVTETTATLETQVDPQGSTIKDAHFDFIPLAIYEKEEFGTEPQQTPKARIPPSVKAKGDLSAASGQGDLATAVGQGDLSAARGTGDVKFNSKIITNVSTSEGTFAVGQILGLDSNKAIPPNTVIEAVGPGTLTLSNPLEGTLEHDSFYAGSPTITNVTTASGEFAIGQSISASGISAASDIVAVGPGTLTLSRPVQNAATDAELHAASPVISNLTTATGKFAAGQIIGGSGIPAGTVIQKVESDTLLLSDPVTETRSNSSLQAGSIRVTNLSAPENGALAVGQAIQGKNIPAGTVIAALGTEELTLSKPAEITDPAAPLSGVALTATGPQPLTATLAGLTPGTGYVFRLSAENGSAETTKGPSLTLYTFSEAPTFGPCPNDPFRTGEFAPFGRPSALLPDCRAYEQVSPVDKNGNDAVGEVGITRAATDGSAATFNTSSGIPGGEGAQQIPTYLATRGADGWTTHGLLPQGSTGYAARVRGWTPDFQRTFSEATRLGPTGREQALFVRTDPGAPATQASAYVQTAGVYSYVGASASGGIAIFEVPAALPPEEGAVPFPLAQAELPNVYAYDTSTRLVSLASVMNTQAQTEEALPRGGTTAAAKGTYTQDTHAVAADGSVFFTATATGQLYQRINPTRPQSDPGPDGYFEDGHCAESAKACTIHISATEKTNGNGPNGADSSGPQSTIFQAATADGSEAFFTSSEKLTNDANTGPEQPPATIGRATLTDPDPNATKDESFIPAHALGMAVDPKGEFIYWAEPVKHSIARANLKAPSPKATVEDEFIDTGETENETYDVKGNVSTQRGHSLPRYVAVGPCAEGGECVYWTNTGPLGNNPTGNNEGHNPIIAGGTIGRATIGAQKAEHIDAEFISGASDPQGIAVNSEHIYWSNGLPDADMFGHQPAVVDATPSGQVLGREVFRVGVGQHPGALAVTGTDLYVVVPERSGEVDIGGAIIFRLPLAKLTEKFEPTSGEIQAIGIDGGGKELRISSISVINSMMFWTAAGGGESGLGSAPIDQLRQYGEAYQCGSTPGCNLEYLTPGGSLFGLASDGTHLFWSSNGESQPNPGNDLYRYSATPDSGGHHLTDLTPDANDLNGAKVFGVLGATPDGSYLYFIANADLDGEEKPGFAGGCIRVSGEVKGRCAIYLLHDGETRFVAPLRMAAELNNSDALDFTLAFSDKGQGLEKTSYLTPGGTLVFRTEEMVTPYGSEGQGQYYRYVPGQGGLSCLTCIPTGETGEVVSPNTRHIHVPGLAVAQPAQTLNRYLSSDGKRFFFQTSARLLARDVDNSKCDPRHACQEQDVYEWEAPGAGSCEAGGPAYSPLNKGCLYLLSLGTNESPSYLSAASADGASVFLFTIDKLVGQDQDEILDLYVARVDGGIAAQNPIAKESCEAEGCLPEAGPAPQQPLPQTPNLVGPEDPKRPKCPKGKVLKKGKCQKKPKHHHRHAKHRGGK